MEERENRDLKWSSQPIEKNVGLAAFHLQSGNFGDV